ncbi:hypothetical protein VTK73DRAFT_6182 [Phialemonium thermophilum]|uniref:Uncharacterized protein n=1 Tax=Phialemonium thermophilum TaxID=223376 RepID=A0ABR3V0I6_9PEZI
MPPPPPLPLPLPLLSPIRRRRGQEVRLLWRRPTMVERRIWCGRRKGKRWLTPAESRGGDRAPGERRQSTSRRARPHGPRHQQAGRTRRHPRGGIRGARGGVTRCEEGLLEQEQESRRSFLAGGGWKGDFLSTGHGQTLPEGLKRQSSNRSRERRHVPSPLALM